jgi:hypothetical protein
MVLQMVRKECVRFGGHVDIQVSYKILQLEVQKEALVLHNPPCFQDLDSLVVDVYELRYNGVMKL